MTTVTASRPSVVRTSPPPPSAFGPGRCAAVAASSLAILAAAGALGCGLSLRISDVGMRDSEGYVTAVVTEVHSDGHAVVWDRDELDNGTALLDLPDELYGPIKVEARSPAGEVFVGIADPGDAEDYLAGVAHAKVVSLEAGRRPSYDVAGGSELPGPPAALDIWYDSVAGPGRQTLVVPPDAGDLAVVVMRPDGTAPVDAEIRTGARLPWLDDLALGLFKIGMNLGAAGALGLWASLRLRR